ncbi:MAG: hypothetical protein JWR00_1008, partial [Rubritepida sp.]|nr:hypothetical protein [Rubritepida sp.]
MPSDRPSRYVRFFARQHARLRKLGWWAVTGQLPRQLRQREGMIRARWDYLVDSLLLRSG